MNYDDGTLITLGELKCALSALRFWFRHKPDDDEAYRGSLLHPQDAANDIMISIDHLRTRISDGDDGEGSGA